ncbi:MAG: fatty acyl-AMP ligase [Actinobacteria bacterium]|nr:MAG: fatty acyl-AMP ligase [Actinomycetota bacterium]
MTQAWTSGPAQARSQHSTLTARIERATTRGGTATFVGSGDPEPVSWARLHDDARAVAANLQRRGISPGDRLALLAPTSRSLVTTIQATWLAGATVVVLPLPMRLGSVEDFVAQTRARVRSADVGMTLVDRDLAAFLDPDPADPPLVLLDEVTPGPGRAGAADLEEPAIDPASLAILQFTSGSTADPKGVMLPHAQIGANIDAIAEAARLDVEGDVIVSWLPLYHDMGLIGLLMTPMTTGTDLVLGAPQDFMAAPGRWMQWMSDFGGTVTCGPNFAYALAARALRRQSGWDLSRWRVALNGAEPVDPQAVDDFCAAGAPHGLDPKSMFCVFGMAEATLAVTFPEPGSGMTTDTVDRRALEHEGSAAPVAEADERGRRLARLGRPLPGLEIRIVEPASGIVRSEREVGELEVRGNSVTPGYYRHADATAEAFRGDWLRTGDLAYMADGELVVCGRMKDVIIIGGRNVYPEDIERAVGTIPGVRQGNVIAFGVEGRKGREALVVVAETKVEDPQAIRQAVAKRVRHAVGLTLEEVVLVNPGSLPKTSSGKLQRSLCRSRYLAAELGEG